MVYHEQMATNTSPTIENRKARHDFEILETFEAGMALMGSEVKSLRGGKANLQDAHVRIKDGEAWLIGAHIALYSQGGAYGHDDPGRSRKLLLKKVEIERLGGRMAREGLTIIPLKIYFTRGYAKLLLGLARGKKKHDKREDLRKRDSLREMQRLAKGGKVRG
jgi:SsrA-binding protein